MTISVIIPAHNEEAYIPQTLSRIKSATARLLDRIELIVVDNASTDSTAKVAACAEAKVISEPQPGTARARNRGAREASGEVLAFVDADTLVPDELFLRIDEVMNDPHCLGGAVDIKHVPARRWVRIYLELWRMLGVVGGMAQGAAQFCRRDVFTALGGYDESLWMGEDVDFYWRLKQMARRQHGRVFVISDIQVLPSPRRFDQWPMWRILVWTNPLFIWVFRHHRRMWSGWYDRPVR